MDAGKFHLVSGGEKAKEKDAERRRKARQQTALWVGSVAILVFAAITFIFVPSVARGSARTPRPFGSFAGKAIELTPGSVFADMVNRYQSQRRTQSGSDYAMLQDAFNATVLHYAFSQAVKDSGYVVPDAQVDREMLPYFSDENGVFSPRLFRDAPDSTKIALRKEIADNLVFRRYYEDVFGQNAGVFSAEEPLYGRKSSSAENAFWKRAGKKQRSFELASFNLSDYPRAEAAAFVKEQPDLFAKYDLSVITVSSEAAAKKLLSQLARNEVLFADAVTGRSSRFYSGDDGKLSASHRYRWQIKDIVPNEADVAALASLAPDSLSGVIETINGYSIFRADGAPVEADVSSGEAVDAAYDYIRLKERTRIEDYFVGVGKDLALAAGRDGFAAACKAFSAVKTDVSAFPINYGNNPVLGTVSLPAELAGNERNESFFMSAFSLQAGEISNPLVLGERIVVLKLAEETEKADEPDSGNTPNALFRYYAGSFDQSAAQTAALNDKRLKNNFWAAYEQYHQN